MIEPDLNLVKVGEPQPIDLEVANAPTRSTCLGKPDFVVGAFDLTSTQTFEHETRVESLCRVVNETIRVSLTNSCSVRDRIE